MSRATFEASWATAEAAVFAILLAGTASTEKKTAFRGYLPAMLDVWSLTTGPGGGNEQSTWAPTKASVHILGAIRGVFGDRERAMQFVMQCARVLPIANHGNVQTFRIRIGGWPEVMAEPYDLANERQRVLAFTVNIGCELVFNTGGVD